MRMGAFHPLLSLSNVDNYPLKSMRNSFCEVKAFLAMDLLEEGLLFLSLNIVSYSYGR